MKEDWKFVVPVPYGAQSAIDSGLMLTQKSPAMLWALILQKVSILRTEHSAFKKTLPQDRI